MRITLENFQIVKQLKIQGMNVSYVGYLKNDPSQTQYLIQAIQILFVENMSKIRQEAERILQLQHPILLEKKWIFVEQLEGTNFFVLITKYYQDLINLKQLVNSCKLSLKDKLQIMLKLINFLEYLHSKNMHLGSISLSQIYILDSQPLLNYFYFSQIFDEINLMRSQNSACELCIALQTLEKGLVDQKSDIQCLRFLFYQMLRPLCTLNEFSSQVASFSTNCPIYNEEPRTNFLLEKMVKAKPQDRFSLTDAKQILRGVIEDSSNHLSVVSELVRQQKSQIKSLSDIKPRQFVGKYQILKILSDRGKMSYLTFDEYAQEERMLKIIEVPELQLQNTLLELKEYAKIKHEDLIEIKNVTSFEVIDYPGIKLVAIVSDYYPEGSAEDALLGMAWMTLNQTKNICLKVTSALSYLHKQGIVHQNIKIQNIYRKKEKWILGEKLTIFQLGKRQQKYSKPSLIPLECPPECMDNKSPEQSSDVWCLAVLFLTTQLNQLIKQSGPLNYDINSGDYIIDYLGKTKIDQSSKEWIIQATHKNPSQRISLEIISAELSKTDENSQTIEQLLSKIDEGNIEDVSKEAFYDSDEQKENDILTDEPRNCNQNDLIKEIKVQIKYPYNCIGRISSKFSDRKSFSGSGFLISHGLVLTCAHNIYNKQRQEDAKKILFIHPQGTFKVASYHYPSIFRASNISAREKDYCILLLEKTVPIDKFLNIAADYDEISQKIEIAGYKYQKETVPVLCHARERIKKINKGFIEHNIPTNSGLSGSPLLIQTFHNFYYVVGIHFGRYLGKQNLKGFGIHINRENVHEILGFAKQMTKKESPFTFISYKRIKLPEPQLTRDDYRKSSEKIIQLQRQLKEEEQKNKQSYQIMTLNLRLGNQLNRSGKYREGIKHFQRVLQIAEKNMDHQYLYKGYSDIGNGYNYLKQHKIALEYYLKALKMVKKKVGGDNPSVASTYLNIGAANHHLGRSQDALRYYQKAISIFKIHSRKQQIASALNNMAIIQKINYGYEEAYKNFKEALEIREKLFGSVNLQSLSILNNLAGCYFMMGRRMEGWECYYKCMLNMRTLEIPEQHPDYQIIINTLKKHTDSILSYAEEFKPSKQELLLLEKIYVRLNFDDALLMRLRQSLRNLV